ncbi:MAG: hypothetical protein LKJ25_02685 [Clostridia bacterium]|jgi:hypothetical protein|nr:hypothetical protein [Clostridia bacterium]
MNTDKFTERQKAIIKEFAGKAHDKGPLEVYEIAMTYILMLKKEGLDSTRASEIISEMMLGGDLDERTQSMVETIMGFMSDE